MIEHGIQVFSVYDPQRIYRLSEMDTAKLLLLNRMCIDMHCTTFRVPLDIDANIMPFLVYLVKSTNKKKRNVLYKHISSKITIQLLHTLDYLEAVELLEELKTKRVPW